jgi:hypothetical protein
MLETKQVVVGTTAISIFGKRTNPIQLVLHNGVKSSNEFIWLGGSSAVTTSTGAHLDNAGTYYITLNPGNELWAITDAGTKTLHVIAQEL